MPVLYAEHTHVTPAEARSRLKAEFTEMGRYDRRYYSAPYWIELLCPGKQLSDIFRRLKTKPKLFQDTLEFVKELHLHYPLIVLSTTTHDFINLELHGAESYFRHVHSTLDDFDTAGKTKAIFEKVANTLSLPADRLLHVGDCAEMDVKNAREAGWNAFFFDKSRPRFELMAELKKVIAVSGNGD